MMNETYWDSLSPTYNFKETLDLQVLVDLIKRYCDSVFECSTGTGIIPKMLRDSGFNGEYLGSDYANGFLKWAKDNNPSEQFIPVDLFDPIPVANDSYDCCVVHHGLEYVYPYKPALAELKRIAKKYVFITFWCPFIEGENQVRFNENGGWNVNFYNELEFYNTLEELGLTVELDVVMTGNDRKYNHLLMLKVCE